MFWFVGCIRCTRYRFNKETYLGGLIAVAALTNNGTTDFCVVVCKVTNPSRIFT